MANHLKTTDPHPISNLAEAAEDALGHVNVVASSAARTVGTRLGFDCDGLRWADGLAQLAGNASLLTAGVSAKRMLSCETREQVVRWFTA